MAIKTESILRGYLYDWLASVLSTLWAGAGGARPAGKVEFVWHMENNSRPATPLLEGRLGMDDRIGRDTLGAPSNATGHVGEQTITGDRECMLYLHWFGPGALDGLKTVRNACNDPVLLSSLQSNKIAIVECHPVIDAHQYLDTASEDGATLDLRLRYSETWTSTPPGGIIEHANIGLEINGITLDTITV